MELTSPLLRAAAARPHVLLVATPGHTLTRLRAEAEIGRRGWPLADSPADADLLVVAGHAGPQLAPVIATVWSQMPAPRARLTLTTTTTEVADALDAGVRDLADVETQRRAPHPEPVSEGATGMPGGIPMADLGEDRDGLMLDALHVPVGPVLPDWPAGLVVRVVLQGDVIVEAEAEILDPPEATTSFWAGPGSGTIGDLARRAAAGHLDGLARFLGVAGWDDPAARARRLRDALLAGDPAGPVIDEVADLLRRIRRSRTLRWLIRGIPAGDDDVAGRLTTRLTALRGTLEALADPRPAADADARDLERLPVERSTVAPGELAAALVGAEFAAARLVVAVLDPDPDLADPTGEGVRGGRA